MAASFSMASAALFKRSSALLDMDSDSGALPPLWICAAACRTARPLQPSLRGILHHAREGGSAEEPSRS